MSVVQTVLRVLRGTEPVLSMPDRAQRERRQCETTGCAYRGTRTVAHRDGLTVRCEGCTAEGVAFGWWECVEMVGAR